MENIPKCQAATQQARTEKTRNICVMWISLRLNLSEDHKR